MQKKELRKRIKTILGNLSAQDKENKSSKIATLLFSTEWWNKADIVLIYLSMGDEVNTAPIIKQALAEKLYIPRMQQERLVFHKFDGRLDKTISHPYGLLEPLPDAPALVLNKLKHEQILIIVPGLGFDRRKNRLGRGRGFYDRFILDMRNITETKCVNIALCFIEQLVDDVPVDQRDQSVDGIVTEGEVI
jgi:5-formyltetrahydrofolate cyclo-ligase